MPPAELSVPERYYDKNEKGWCFGHWTTSHAEVEQFPDNPTDLDKESIRAYFQGKARFTPCRLCGAHFYQIMQKNPITCNSKEELKKWLIDAHNEVNKTCGHKLLDDQAALSTQKWNRSVKWSLVAQDLQDGKLQYVETNYRSLSWIFYILLALLVIGFIFYIVGKWLSSRDSNSIETTNQQTYEQHNKQRYSRQFNPDSIHNSAYNTLVDNNLFRENIKSNTRQTNPKGCLTYNI